MAEPNEKPREAAPQAEPITIKKYANRRLYNTATSSYVTLDHLCQMVKDGKEFVVYDAKTGDDITRTVLTQIIFEEESKGQNLLPISFLRNLISFYGDSLQSLVPGYLDVSMSSFSKNQEQMRSYMTEALNGMFPFARFEDMGRHNMAMFQRAMSMFNPFAGGAPGAGPGAATPGPKPADGQKSAAQSETELSELRAQVDLMREQLDHLARKKD